MFDIVSHQLDVPPPPPSIVTSSLLVHLDAGDSSSYSGSGTTWYNLVSGGNNATLYNGPTYSSSDGGYFHFDGSNDHVRMSNSGFNNPSAWPYTGGKGNFTYETWVNFDTTGSYYTIFENGSWTDCLLLRHQSNKLYLYAEGLLLWNLSWTPTTGTWYNIVLKRQVYNFYLYINNSLIGSLSYSPAPSINISNNYIYLMGSQHSSSQRFDGKMSVFMVYDKALSDSERQENYDTLKGRYGY